MEDCVRLLSVDNQWSTADGENCTIHTRDGRVYTGVVLNTEPSVHVADSAVETKEENMEILLDENVDTKEGTLSLGVQPGDIIAMDPRTQITTERLVSKAVSLDDKLSASILLGLAKCVKMNLLRFRKVSHCILKKSIRREVLLPKIQQR